MKGADLQLFQELSEIFSLIPLNGKTPIEENWTQRCEKKRPFNPEDFKGKNAGIACGPASGSIVVDVDDTLRFNTMIEEKGWDLPYTRMHMTGAGKPHYLYRYPDNGKRYGCRSQKALDFDIKGLGGQIVAPGSIHPDSGKPYTVRHDLPMAPAPVWVLNLAAQEEPGEPINTPTEDVDLASLPIGLAVKKLIREGEPKGARSEAIMSVLNSLARANVSDDTIFSVFETYPIGQKYHEKGNAKRKWLQDQINKVRATYGDNKQSRGLTLTELEQRFTVKTDWLWRQHIPQGQPTILNGREGVGKTSIMMVAAREIIEEHPTGSVVWCATEGKVLDCVNKMRIIGLTERFYVAQKGDGTFKFNFQWQSDLKELDTILANSEKPILAVFVDSIRGMSLLGDNDDKIGGVMHRVNALVCDKYRASLVYIDHWGKGRKEDILDRNVGTTAKTAAVSAVLSVIGKTKYTREIKNAKSNIGEIPDLLSVQAANQITIRQPHEETAETMATRAEAFLLELGTTGDVRPATEVYKLAEEQNISPDVLKKTKLSLGIIREREGPSEPWMWRWPL